MTTSFRRKLIKRCNAVVMATAKVIRTQFRGYPDPQTVENALHRDRVEGRHDQWHRWYREQRKRQRRVRALRRIGYRRFTRLEMDLPRWMVR